MNYFRTISREDNIVSSVYRLLSGYHIKIPLTAVNEYLKAHRDYPSLKSICDFFKEIKLDNYPLRVEAHDLYGFPRPYLVHLNIHNGRVLVVYKITNKYVIYSDSSYGKKVISIQQFLDKWEGVIIVVQPSKKSRYVNHKNQWYEYLIDKYLFPISIVLLIIIGLFNWFNFYKLENDKDLFIVIMLLHSTGLLFSILVARNEINLKSYLSDKLCHFSALVDCDAVSSSSASKLFGHITWADVGVTWFTAGLVLIFFFKGFWIFNLLGFLTLLSLPYPIYSILYQKFILKKWCPLCMGVQSVLVVEFVLLFRYLAIRELNLEKIMITVITFIPIMTLVLLLKRNVILKRERNELNLELLKIRRDPNIFINQLLSEKRIVLSSNFPTITLGKQNYEVTVTIFLNLFCSGCARQFPEIMELIKSLENVRIQIIIYPGSDELTVSLFKILRFCLKTGEKNKAALVLLSEWYSLNPNSRLNLLKKFPTAAKHENVESMIKRSKLYFETGQIERVPAVFIEGFPLPKHYKIKDLKYLLSEIKIYEHEREERQKV